MLEVVRCSTCFLTILTSREIEQIRPNTIKPAENKMNLPRSNHTELQLLGTIEVCNSEHLPNWSMSQRYAEWAQIRLVLAGFASVLLEDLTRKTRTNAVIKITCCACCVELVSTGRYYVSDEDTGNMHRKLNVAAWVTEAADELKTLQGETPFVLYEVLFKLIMATKESDNPAREFRILAQVLGRFSDVLGLCARIDDAAAITVAGDASPPLSVPPPSRKSDKPTARPPSQTTMAAVSVQNTTTTPSPPPKLEVVSGDFLLKLESDPSLHIDLESFDPIPAPPSSKVPPSMRDLPYPTGYSTCNSKEDNQHHVAYIEELKHWNGKQGAIK